MRVAALYDVHGNLPALEAVLAEVASLEVDRIVVGGDVVAGPFPRECLDKLVALGDARASCAATPTASRRALPAGHLGVDRSRSSTRSRVEFLAAHRHARRRRSAGVLYCHGYPARRRRDPHARLPRRAVARRARRRRGAPRRRRAHARPVRARGRRDPLRQRRQRRHAVRGQAAARSGRCSDGDDVELPAHAVRRRGGRGRDPRRAGTRARTSSPAGCSSREDPDEVSAYFETHCHVASSARRGGRVGPRRDRIRPIIERLAAEHADARIALRFRTPLELLVSVMLSAQTTDVNVNRVTERLFEKYRRPEDYLAVPGGGARARHLRDRVLPPEDEVDPRDDARAAGGVRRRGAAARSRSCCGCRASRARRRTSSRPSSATPQGVVVDTHVRRLSQRLGLTRQEDPVKIERDLVRLVPRADWGRFPHLLIWHGRRICDARRPLCEECVAQRPLPVEPRRRYGAASASRSRSVSGRLAPPLPSITATTSSSSATTRPSGAPSVTFAVTLFVAEAGERRGADDLHVRERQLRAVLDRRPRRDVVPDRAGPQPELLLEPVVEHLLREGEVDGLVDVPVRVQVAPADVDALLVQPRAQRGESATSRPPSSS